MILIVGPAGDEWLADSGIDVRTLLWRRKQGFALVQCDESGVQIVFADDAAEAAGLLLTMIGNGLQAEDLGPVPSSIKTILADHAQGLH